MKPLGPMRRRAVARPVRDVLAEVARRRSMRWQLAALEAQAMLQQRLYEFRALASAEAAPVH